MSNLGIYTYPHNQQVSLGNFSMPINQTKLVIYKGANNPLSFTVHNADGKYTILKDTECLIFSIFDNRNNTKIYDAVLEATTPSWVSESGQARPTISNSTKVYYTGCIPAGIIQDLSAGTKYRWSIRKQEVDTQNVPQTQYLYTGLNYECSAELEISTLAAPVFIGSTEISDRINSAYTSINNKEQQTIAKGFVGEYDVRCSSPIQCGVQYGLVDGLSTIAFYFNEFIGRYQLQGCLLNEVPKDSEDYKWFNIDLEECQPQEYIENEFLDTGVAVPINGIRAYNFKGNFMWVRVCVCVAPVVRDLPDFTKRKEYNVLKSVPKVLIRR